MVAGPGAGSIINPGGQTRSARSAPEPTAIVYTMAKGGPWNAMTIACGPSWVGPSRAG
jgi:hypothetical protein